MLKIRHLLLLISLIGISFSLKATHNRAGEISYRQISQFTYEITLITYTATGPGPVADRSSLVIQWGDNTETEVPRSQIDPLPGYYQRNTYIGTHTFPGAGIYVILMEDPNRNAGVENIESSVDVMFAVRTTLQINPLTGFNNTPILLNDPLDKGAVGQKFIHNPGAYDPDGDSLSYKITKCLGNFGEPIDSYQYPESSNTPIYVDELTGDLVWDSPTKTGVFNLAMIIEEWRFGIKIGEMMRDLQVEIKETDNEPPEISPLPDVCVQAGEYTEFQVVATDDINQRITLKATGGPFEVTNNPANFTVTSIENGKTVATFNWNTLCEHIRKRPYTISIKATDDDVRVPLVNFREGKITVVAPPPVNLTAEAANNSVTVSWEAGLCADAAYYEVYRKKGTSNFTPSECQTGLPPSSGFQLIGRTETAEITTFLDNDNEKGLLQGHIYCYRVVAIYPDGAKSYASAEICTELVRGIPVITKVSVKNTSAAAGEMELEWIKPTEFDQTIFPPPYSYTLYRSEGFWGENLVEIATLDGIDNTIYLDNNLNTKELAYSYKVELYSGTGSSKTLVGIPQICSSTFISLNSGDNSIDLKIEKNVSWIDTTFTVFRKKTGDIEFEELAVLKSETYVDKNVELAKEYCYFVKSDGYFMVENFKEPIINFSQEACEEATDIIPPCPPTLSVKSECDAGRNHLTWQLIDNPCSDDIVSYKIYYRADYEGDMELIETINDPEQLSFYHLLEGSLAACYALTAVDISGNESKQELVICVDECSEYELPNVFTPNGDGKNDLFVPIKRGSSVEKVKMKIFNRWGKLVYETEEPNINWSGKYLDTNKYVSESVYYYTCEVFERRLSGLESRFLTGFIHLISKEENSTTE